MTARLPSANTRGGIALLLALFTLLCAICPLGLPASQKLGPAFNPANEAVTVRPEAKLLAARPDIQTPNPRSPAPLLGVRPLVDAIPSETTAFALAAAPGLGPHPAPTSFFARGPPVRA